MQPREASRKSSFTIRSSREWKEMTENRPPSFKLSIPEAMPRARLVNSSLTAIRSAWKVLVAGWILPCLMCAGMAAATIEASSSVVTIGPAFLLSAMARAMRPACNSSP